MLWLSCVFVRVVDSSSSVQKVDWHKASKAIREGLKIHLTLTNVSEAVRHLISIFCYNLNPLIVEL